MSSAFPRPTISAANGCAIIAAFPLKRLHHRMRLHFHWPGGADHSTRKWRPHVNCGTDSAITPMAMLLPSADKKAELPLTYIYDNPKPYI